MGYHSSVTWSLGYNIFRSLLAQIDTILFTLLEWLYKLFFNVATSTSDLFSNEMVMNFFTRIQLIIGVFMMFQLALSIIKGIMSPDTFTDSKTGFGNLIMRIMTALVMLTLLVPINIPSPRNEYEKQINNNGILFGTLYSLQNRILMNNTIGKLVLGNTGDDYTGGTDDNYDQKLTRSAKMFVVPIIKTVLKPNFVNNNLKPEELTQENLVCQNDTVYSLYDMWKDPRYLSAQSVTDKSGKNRALVDFWDIEYYFWAVDHEEFIKCGGEDGMEYAFNYSIIVSTAIAVLCIFFFLSFIIEVAKRSIKLGILRLIAPIPIISYMDSKSGKDGAFAAWVKLLIKTYLDLFLRLIIIHFMIFVILALVNSGFYARITDQGMIGYMTFLAIIIGLLAFAKEAPKFMKDALGLKGDGFSLFGGLGAALGAGAIAAGTIGSFNASRSASRRADIERAKSFGLSDAAARRYANLNAGKHLLSGMVGAGAGAAKGIGAYTSAKDHGAKAAMDAINARNKKVLDSGRSGGTFFGAVGSSMGQALRGESAYDRREAKWKADEQKIKDDELKNKKDADINAYRKAIMDRVSSKAVDKEGLIATYKTGGRYGDIHGNYRNWHSVSQAALTSGTGVYTINEVDANGNVVHDASGNEKKVQVFDYDGKQIRVDDIGDLDIGMLDAMKEAYYEKAITDEKFDGDVWGNKQAYENATGGYIEGEWGGEAGIKSKYGEENRRITKSNSELSQKREEINKDKQSASAQRQQSNANRFKNK